MEKEAIIIFQKNPEKGKVKTRLSAEIGEEKALEVYKSLCNLTYKACNAWEGTKFLFFDSYLPQNKILGTENYNYQVQGKGDLGYRMEEAFQRIFKQGFEKVILIGTDCPELTSDHLKEAFLQLENYRIVIGPAKDGGYYLIGAKRETPPVFKGIPWSTDQVLKLTRKKLETLGLSYGELETLSDIDTKKDWDHFKEFLTNK
ncbi:MAG: TIGR04282 family arsenosugar biosynthesis glycosyltransferase [Algoriphagus sp.]|uniref:TIGR04282 family arsenosugar biosynthesis glycosyltransferase n=1 Tax=Algoriphagus sp. TaxID=1872435 RepID=UPI0017EBABA4|nr:TIGR04282 family arsenosugar biosynthesis glycosyltransferase [Algoriphagus sp.]NVJ86181.1 TIGR04282 family arsenosugar biosynthesis glycosyltransferase [Algoriphagus sp.]